MNQLTNWTTGLDQEGWIAAVLMLIFFVIIIVTLIMLWQLKSSHLNTRLIKKAKPDVKKEQTPLEQAEESNKESASLYEEAEVYIAYGLNQQAINALNKHLLAEPNDTIAKALLEKISQPEKE